MSEPYVDVAVYQITIPQVIVIHICSSTLSFLNTEYLFLRVCYFYIYVFYIEIGFVLKIMSSVI